MSGLTRREFCAITGGAAAAILLNPRKLESAPKQRFNILWLMTDQHIYSAMGCAGNPVIKTPNLDALAAEGARFTHATCVTPFCSPTRASFILGRYPHAHGVTGNVKNEKRGLTDPCLCMENILFDKGWTTAQLGKWHLGRQRDLRCYAGSETFTESKKRHLKEYLEPLGDAALDSETRPGEVASAQRFMTEEMAAVVKNASRSKKNEKNGGRRSQKSAAKPAGRSAIKPEHIYESWLADQCIDLLERHQDRNFQITFSVSPPHAPWFCPAPYYDMYDPANVPWPASANHCDPAYKDDQSVLAARTMGERNRREYIRAYYGQVTMMDAVMGRVLVALKRLGLEENTLVLYTSDHGDMQSAHSCVGKSVFAFYEEILRVPLIIRYPGHIAPGKVLRCSASSVDLMPTLLDYAGLSIPEDVQGRSLRPYLEGEKADDFETVFCGRGSGENERFGRMIRIAKVKYCYYGDGRRELFDLAKDPFETKNVARDKSYRTLKNSLHKRLRDHAADTDDPAFEHIPVV